MVGVTPQVAFVLLPTIVGLSLVLMLIRPRGIAEVYWVCGGALLLLLLRLISVKLALKAISDGFDVYSFLIGMMLLSELARVSGVFDWLSSSAVRGAKNSSVRLFTLVYGIGIVTTVFLSNDATAVVLTPAILKAVRKANVRAYPHLFACALIANAASFVLPISNPANLVVFRHAMPPLGRWLLSFAVPSLLSIAVTYGVMRVAFRKDLRCAIDREVSPEPLTSHGKLVLASLGCVIGVLLLASAFDINLGLPTAAAALIVTVAISIRARSNPLTMAREISWETLALVAGLFVLEHAVESKGALTFTVSALHRAQLLPPAGAAVLVGSVVGLVNNLVNNLPLGLIAGATLHGAHATGLLANAVLIGVDLGPNLSVTGSLATILWLLALRKEKLDVSFWHFLRLGVFAMPAALLAAIGGLVLVHTLFRAN